jgi:hypothetical protein
MKGERKLRLVVGGGPAAPGEDDPLARAERDAQDAAADIGDLGVVKDEERAEAEALREALAAGTDPFARALGAAHAPRALPAPDLEAILASALAETPAAPRRAPAVEANEPAATPEERADAERLRAALDETHAHTEPSDDAELARALRAAVAPSALDPRVNEAMIQAALRRAVVRLPRRIAPVTMAALASIAAMAAGVALLVGRANETRHRPDRADGTAALLHARSAEELFDAATPFPRRGEESLRIDRIASARAADLRKNRFAAWGVK